MKKKVKKAIVIKMVKASASALSIVAQFKGGEQAQLKASKRLKKEHRNRSKAQQAMLPAFAKHYGAAYTTTKGGKVKWKKGDRKAAAAKKALNRLLALAYGSKKATTNSRTFNVDASAARIVSGHSTAYCRRLVARINALLRRK